MNQQGDEGRPDEILKEIAAAGRQLEKLVKNAKQVFATDAKGKNVTLFAAEELAGAKKAADGVAKIDTADLAGRLTSALGSVEEAGRRSAEKEAMRLLSQLDSRVREVGLKLVGHYPEVVAGVVTLLLELTGKGMQVSLFYGPRLERLGSVPGADADKVFEAFQKARDELEAQVLPDEEFLPQLFAAWELARKVRGGDETGPLPVLDVLATLAFVRQPERFRRNPVRAAFQPFGQAAFSYQLFKLRERRFQGRDLALGIATRDDVKRKASLWVPRNLRGEGNHYSTLDFRRSQ